MAWTPLPGCPEAFDSNGKLAMRTAPWQNGETMRMRWLAFWLLAATSGSVAAAWPLLGSTEGAADIYIDRATISKSGHTVKMWIMEDYKGPRTFSGKTFQSAKLQQEYDCKDGQRRTVQSTLHSAQKGNGTVVHTGSQPTAWRPITADTVAETMWKMACGKK